MSERRMFAKTIIDSDAFLDMPLSTQSLYFHLSMRADDEGFINNPKKIQRMIGASEDDLKVLMAKSFIIPFESGIVVIKHWRINNLLRSDRKIPTVYKEELGQLTVKENGAYTLTDNHLPTICQPSDNQVTTKCQPNVRIGKDSIVEDSIVEDIYTDTDVSVCPSETEGFTTGDVIVHWNKLESVGIKPVARVSSGTKRYSSLRSRISEYGYEKVLEAIDKVAESKFLRGYNNRGWVITFDWFVLPNNFIKVLEGNYDDKPQKTKQHEGRLNWIDDI